MTFRVIKYDFFPLWGIFLKNWCVKYFFFKRNLSLFYKKKEPLFWIYHRPLGVVPYYQPPGGFYFVCSLHNSQHHLCYKKQPSPHTLCSPNLVLSVLLFIPKSKKFLTTPRIAPFSKMHCTSGFCSSHFFFLVLSLFLRGFPNEGGKTFFMNWKKNNTWFKPFF